MRPQHPQSDADDRLIKMVAAILVLSLAFWLYKQYFAAPAAVAPTAPAQAAAAPTAAPPAPSQALWSDGGEEDVAPAEEATVTEVVPDEVLARERAEAQLQQEQARLAQALAANNPQPGSYIVQPSAADIRRARCQASKDHREAVLAQAGLNRSFDLLRQLDDQVYEACKGL